MPIYTRRPTFPDQPDRTDDYVFRYDEADVGRCYLRGLTGGSSKWWWTIYIGGGPGRAMRPVDGVRTAGEADSLDQAQSAFKLNFEKLIAAGVVSDPRG